MYSSASSPQFIHSNTRTSSPQFKITEKPILSQSESELTSTSISPQQDITHVFNVTEGDANSANSSAEVRPSREDVDAVFDHACKRLRVEKCTFCVCVCVCVYVG